MPTRAKSIEAKRISNAAKQARWGARPKSKPAVADTATVNKGHCPQSSSPALSKDDQGDSFDLSTIEVALPSVTNNLSSGAVDNSNASSSTQPPRAGLCRQSQHREEEEDHIWLDEENEDGTSISIQIRTALPSTVVQRTGPAGASGPRH